MKPTDFAVSLSDFLTVYLPGQRNVSPNTIKSYRDAFILLLRYCRDVKGMRIEKLCAREIDAPLIADFLDYLEKERCCSIRTRNQRLAAIHAFFRHLQTENPDRIMQCQRILSLPSKRHSIPIMSYLSVEEVKTVLAQPDVRKRDGYRDAVILSLLYDSGARVQEIIDLTAGDVRLDVPMQIRLTGKGRKSRIVPLMSDTTEILKNYMRSRGLLQEEMKDEYLFRNHQGEKLTRSGVRYILSKYVEQSRPLCAGLPERISPHTLRHTKAMHMYDSDVSLPYIRDFLGHSHVKTCEFYAKADLKMKRQALQKSSKEVFPSMPFTWQQDHGLMDWLKSL